MSRRKNLSKAREQRRFRTSELRDVSMRQVHIEDVLEDPSHALGRCPVYIVLRRAPGLGEAGVEKLLKKCNVYAMKPLAQVPPGKREALVRELPQRARNR